MRERLAYLIMIGMLLVLVTFVMAIIGKGEYQPPSPEIQEEQGSALYYNLTPRAVRHRPGPAADTTAAMRRPGHDRIPGIHSRRSGRAGDTQRARRVASGSFSRVDYARLLG